MNSLYIWISAASSMELGHRPALGLRISAQDACGLVVQKIQNRYYQGTLAVVWHHWKHCGTGNSAPALKVAQWVRVKMRVWLCSTCLPETWSIRNREFPEYTVFSHCVCVCVWGRVDRVQTERLKKHKCGWVCAHSRFITLQWTCHITTGRSPCAEQIYTKKLFSEDPEQKQKWTDSSIRLQWGLLELISRVT